MATDLITDPADLRPDTSWTDTIWAHTAEESLADHQTRARLCVATLLPFADGKPDWQGFENSIRWMQACADHYRTEIAYVLNADTGYIFQLDAELYREVIERFRAILPMPASSAAPPLSAPIPTAITLTPPTTSHRSTSLNRLKMSKL